MNTNLQETLFRLLACEIIFGWGLRPEFQMILIALNFYIPYAKFKREHKKFNVPFTEFYFDKNSPWG